MSGQLSSVQEEGLRRAFSRKQVLSSTEQQGLAKLLGIQESRLESWFQARRKEREDDVVDIVDLESDEEAMDDISDDEGPGEATDNVKTVNGSKEVEGELEEVKREMAYILKNTVRKEDMEALEAKCATLNRHIQDKEVEVKNLEAMNVALTKRSDQGKEANVWKAKYSTTVKHLQERDAKVVNLEGLVQDFNLNFELAKKEHANNVEHITRKLESEEQVKSQIKAEVNRLRSELQAGSSRMSKLDLEMVEVKADNSSLRSDLTVSRALAQSQDEQLAAVSSDGGEKVERLKFQVLDQADELVVQAKCQRLLEQDAVEVRERLAAREVEVAECREGLASMAKVQKMQQQVVARIESQGKIIINQKLMIQQYKEQAQAQLAQIARLAEIQRKASATSQATSVLNAELGRSREELVRSRSNEAALNRELGMRARQVLQLRQQVPTQVTGSSQTGVKEVELEEAVKVYTRILQARRKGQEAPPLNREQGATLIPGVLEKEQGVGLSPATWPKEQESEVLLRSDPLEEEVVVQVAEEVVQGNTGDFMSHKEVVQGNPGDFMRHKEVVQGNPDDFRRLSKNYGMKETSESVIDLDRVKEMKAKKRAVMEEVVRKATEARKEKKDVTDIAANTATEVIEILDTTDESIEAEAEDPGVMSPDDNVSSVDVDESWSLSSDDDEEHEKDGHGKMSRKRSLTTEVEHSFSKRRRGEESEVVDISILVNSILLSIIEGL